LVSSLNGGFQNVKAFPLKWAIFSAEAQMALPLLRSHQGLKGRCNACGKEPGYFGEKCFAKDPKGDSEKGGPKSDDQGIDFMSRRTPRNKMAIYCS
jgi:hypothetical protein